MVDRSYGWLPVFFACLFSFVFAFGMLPVFQCTVNEAIT